MVFHGVIVAVGSSLCSFRLMARRDTESHLSSSTSVRFYPHDLVSSRAASRQWATLLLVLSCMSVLIYGDTHSHTDTSFWLYFSVSDFETHGLI